MTLLDVTAANGNIELQAASGSITGGTVSASGTAGLLAGGSIAGTSVIAKPSATLTAGVDISSVYVEAGSVVLEAGGSIDAGTAAGSLTASAGGDIVISESDDVTLLDVTAANGNIDLQAASGSITGGVIEAGSGSLTMKQDSVLDLRSFTFDNQSNTDLTLESFSGSVSVVGASKVGKSNNAADQWKSIKATAQSGIEFKGSGSITTGALQSTTENISVHSTSGNLIVNGTVKADVGGVELIADAGMIYTEDGSNDTLNVGITGFSDGKKGVKLPHGDGKAAIVIKSKSDLKLGSEATLTAGGEYKAYDSDHDDRGSIGFLTGAADKAGDPIDVAIYIGSYDFQSNTGGDVTVDSTVSMETNGTMVIDAGNTVNSFGTNFIESPVWKNKTNRLEIVSRTTQTVDQAVDSQALPHAVEARGDEAPLWFQGEQYVLRGKPVAEVLAKVGPVPLVPPLPTELEDRGEIEEADTEEVMLWLEEEGIAPYLAEAYQPTLSTDIDLIKAARKLRECAGILEDITYDQFEGFMRILSKMDSPVYLSKINGRHVKVWHRDNSIVALLSGGWARALVFYVQTCTDEFYMPHDHAVKLCMRKYVNEIEKESTLSKDQDLVIKLLKYVHMSADGLKSNSSVYWTEDSA